MKIKIAQIHVWDKKNKGDVAIVMAAQELLKKYLGDIEIIEFPVEFLKQADEKDIKRLNSCRLAVIGGGGIYYRYFMPYSVSVIKRIKIPIVVFGVGYVREVGARALKPEEKKGIIFLNNQAELVSVRDYYSKKFLAGNGVAGSAIKVIGDPAIFLDEQKCEFKNQNAKVKIGLNLNYSGWLGFGKRQRQILRSYEKTARYFQEKYGAQIYYLLHHPSERVIIRELAVRDLVIIDFADLRRQKYVYSRLDLIIGMMLHSCVLAFGAGTPEINVAYDIRNKNFARFIGFPELSVELDDLRKGVLLKRAAEVFKNRDFYQERFTRRKQAVWEKHKAFLQEIKKIIFHL